MMGGHIRVRGLLPVAAAVCAGLSSVGHAQEKRERPQPRDFVFGARHCESCHAGGAKADEDAILCRLDEAKRRQEHDKHVDAAQALIGMRAREMARRLPPEGGSDYRADARCVSCHGLVVPEGVDTQMFTEADRLKEGVTCVACHGAKEEWVLNHVAYGDRRWRGKTREEKARDYGMTDLWSPASRAKTCASCHVGDPARAKVVTHAMYAAGHPPLPGFELATFTEAMPPHWETLAEKRLRIKNVEARKAIPAAEPAVLAYVAAGATAALGATARLIEADAGGSKQGGAVDFAKLDCRSCHHDLARWDRSQWTLAPGIPGRPKPYRWPTIPAGAALGVSPSDGDAGRRDRDGLTADLGRLFAAFDVRPFGEPNEVAEAAKGLGDRTEAMGGRAAVIGAEPEAARRFLRALAEGVRREPPDVDSARQVAWAFRALGPVVFGGDSEALREADGLVRMTAGAFTPGRGAGLLGTASAGLEGAARFDRAEFVRGVGRLEGRLSER